VTGAGALVKALTHVDDAVDAVKAVDRVGDVVDAVRTAENAGDAVQAANQADNVADAAKCAFNSFSAETVVATADGEEAISELEEGDLVLAYDPEQGMTDVFAVTATISHLDLLVVDLTVDGERLETTPEHPFYVEGYGWVLAEDLWVGAPASQLHAGTGVVESISLVLRPQRMYNLTIAQAHTFFVGQGQWLVHNACNSLSGISNDAVGNSLVRDAKAYHASLSNAYKGTTVAVAQAGDTRYVTAWAGTDPAGLTQLESLATARGANFIPPTGGGAAGHAEQILHRALSGFDDLKIGISRVTGLCPACANYFRSKNFWNVFSP
jgi:hypothetical protein